MWWGWGADAGPAGQKGNWGTEQWSDESKTLSCCLKIRLSFFGNWPQSGKPTHAGTMCEDQPLPAKPAFLWNGIRVGLMCMKGQAEHPFPMLGSPWAAAAWAGSWGCGMGAEESRTQQFLFLSLGPQLRWGRHSPFPNFLSKFRLESRGNVFILFYFIFLSRQQK